jgi:hypothetical protein
MGMTAEERLASRQQLVRRGVIILVLGLVLGSAIVYGISMILDASDYYAQSLAAAMPVPSGRR